MGGWIGGFVNPALVIGLSAAALPLLIVPASQAPAQSDQLVAKVDGVDVIHIGSNDLLTAMGKPGQFGDPEGAKAIDRVISVAVANGKIAGMGGLRP